MQKKHPKYPVKVLIFTNDLKNENVLKGVINDANENFVKTRGVENLRFEYFDLRNRLDTKLYYQLTNNNQDATFNAIELMRVFGTLKLLDKYKNVVFSDHRFMQKIFTSEYTEVFEKKWLLFF